MKKPKKSIDESLNERQFHRPNPILYWLYHVLARLFILRKYHPRITRKDDINDCQGPCFVIWNHLSRIDHAYLLEATYPKRVNILAGYNEFYKSHLHWVFRLMNILPKKNYTTDLLGMKAMMSIIKQGGCIAFAPEGMSSIYGTNQPIVNGTGHLLKHFGVPVYFLKMRGEYLANTKVCLDERFGQCEAELSLLFSPDDLSRLSKEEIDDQINLAFKGDEYVYAHESHVRWETKGRICEHLHDICYHCPRCGKDLTMLGEKDEIHCTNCGNGARMNDYYEFEPFDATSLIPSSPAAWVHDERALAIKEIRENPAYSFSTPAKIGFLPRDHYVKKGNTEIQGEGEFSLDHQGLHFRGTKNGANYAFDLDYTQVFSLVIVTDLTCFGLYVKGEYVELFPATPCVGKLLVYTEEMHRLHANIWKCFPWDKALYDGYAK